MSSMHSSPNLEDQGKILEEALGIVKSQSFQMKKFLVRKKNFPFFSFEAEN